MISALIVGLLLTAAALLIKTPVILNILFWMYSVVCYLLFIALAAYKICIAILDERWLKEHPEDNLYENKEAYMQYLRKGYYENEEEGDEK